MLDEIVFAIPDAPKDDPLAEYLLGRGARLFRGSETDVLTRFHDAATCFKATHIVRVCADNPLIDPEEVDNLVRFYFAGNFDYAYNHIPLNNKYPDGLGAEIVSMKTLNILHNEATDPLQREHIFNFIRDNAEWFSIGTFDPPDSRISHPEIRLDIDTSADYLKFLSLPLNDRMTPVEIISIFRGKACD
jgi:spore coat polysaccharide biosynthesis protein SpsF